MKSLMIDTSNQMLSIAINEDKVLLAEINTNVKVNHSETLMIYIDDLFKAARVKKSEINRIIVARGPGSYTGVRIGATVAKVLATTLDIPLYSVSSLFAMYASAQHLIHEGPVYPIIDARRGTVFASGYDNHDEILQPVHIEFSEIASEPAIFIGNRMDKIASSIPNFHHVQTRISEVEQYDAYIREENAYGFVPEYLRLSEAELNWNQQSKK